MANHHLIGKQVWELDISTSKEAYAIQQQISELVWTELLPQLNTVFDRMAGEDEFLSLAKVEVDVGTIDLAENSLDIVNKIVKSLEDTCFRAKFMVPPKSSDVGETFIEDHYESPAVYFFKIWIYWLINGVLPAYAIRPDERWMQLVLKAMAQEEKVTRQLEGALKANPVALKRLVLQHHTEDLQLIIELFTGHSQSWLLDFIREVKTLMDKEFPGQKDLSARQSEIRLWELTLGYVVIQRKKLKSKTLGGLLVQHSLLRSFRETFLEDERTFGKRYPRLKEAYEKNIKLAGTEGGAIADRTETRQKEEYRDLEEGGVSESGEVSSPQFFRNAGLVLLHPFLTNLFGTLNLLDGTDFRDFKSRCKSVLLLHYMATDRERARDYEMILPKFLCEMPLNMPLDHSLQLSMAEKEESQKVLEAAIDHWGALGSTSPDGLREGFLEREGKLVKEAGGWKLYVEHKDMDILLDRLPWNLSMIKLPWMKDILKVEWR